VLLIAALVGAGAIAWPLLSPDAGATPELLLPLVAVLQALGTFGFARHRAARNVKGGWPVFVGYSAVLVWLIVIASAAAGVAAGPGGLVYGMLITLPALALAPLLQIAALLGFWLGEKSR
jgi:hypothetical protein